MAAWENISAITVKNGAAQVATDNATNVGNMRMNNAATAGATKTLGVSGISAGIKSALAIIGVITAVAIIGVSAYVFIPGIRPDASAEYNESDFVLSKEADESETVKDSELVQDSEEMAGQEKSYIFGMSYLFDIHSEDYIHSGKYKGGIYDQPSANSAEDEVVRECMERIGNEYIHPHIEECESFYEKYKNIQIDRFVEYYENGKNDRYENETKEVTEWFPEEIVINTSVNDRKFTISKVEMELFIHDDSTKPTGIYCSEVKRVVDKYVFAIGIDFRFYGVSDDQIDAQTEKKVFDETDYWNELSEDQKYKLYSVLTPVYEVQDNKNGFKGKYSDERLTKDFSELMIVSEEGLEQVAHYMLAGPGFFDEYFKEGDYAMVAEVPEKEMDRLLKETIDMEFKQRETIGIDSGKDGWFRYENGMYHAEVLDDWSFGYAGLLRITQTDEEEVMIYGVTGIKKSNGFDEIEYDPHKWTLVPDEDFDEYMYTEITHSYTAKARINPNSPCGLTIQGIIYDDEKSLEIAKEEGFNIPASYANKESGNADDGQYIIPDSGTRKLTDADVESMDSEKIRIARNEIYARHGRKFKDEKLQEYFNNQSWYKGTIEADDFDENRLSDIERENAEFLKKKE